MSKEKGSIDFGRWLELAVIGIVLIILVNFVCGCAGQARYTMKKETVSGDKCRVSITSARAVEMGFVQVAPDCSLSAFATGLTGIEHQKEIVQEIVKFLSKPTILPTR